MFSHYVVVLDWANNDAEAVSILGVGHTIEEAKEIFAQYVDEEKNLAEDNGWHIESDTDVAFEAYENGYYAVSHTVLWIQGVD